MEEEKIYVAVGKEIRESKSILTWALRNSGGKRVCIIHVHQLDRHIPTPIGYLAAERAGEAQLKVHREMERRKMSAILDEYLDITNRVGVSIEKLHIEVSCIEKGIIQLIQQHKIKLLVMGAAADKHYHPKRLTDLRSKKAIYVREHAPSFCHIWFVCKGLLIHTRRAILTPIENEAVNDAEGNGLLLALTATEVLPAHWSTDTGAGTIWRSSSEGSKSVTMMSMRLGLERDSIQEASDIQSSIIPVRDAFALQHELEQANENALQILYNEECRRRKEVEAELKRVKQELERVKNNVMVELPKVKDELDYVKNQVVDIARVKSVLEYMKNDVLVQLQSAAEQKALLEIQIGNSTCLLQVLGEKLASAIKLVQNPAG